MENGRDVFGNPMGGNVQGNPEDATITGEKPKDIFGNQTKDIFGNETGGEAEEE